MKESYLGRDREMAGRKLNAQDISIAGIAGKILQCSSDDIQN
jgi:hypothetical protein